MEFWTLLFFAKVHADDKPTDPIRKQRILEIQKQRVLKIQSKAIKKIARNTNSKSVASETIPNGYFILHVDKGIVNGDQEELVPLASSGLTSTSTSTSAALFRR